MPIITRLPHVAALLLAVFGPSIGAHAQTGNDSSRVLSQSYAQSIVVDGNGNLFYVGTNSPTADTNLVPDGIYELVAVNGIIPANATVRELAAAGGAVVAPLQLTVDPLGNVYVTDQVDHTESGYAIRELVAVNGQVPDNPTVRTILAGVSLESTDITSDGQGDIFFTSQSGNDPFSYFIDEIAAVDGAIPDNPTVITLLSQSCGDDCFSLAGYVPFADAAGDLFYGSGGNIYELPAVGGIITPGETPVTIFRPATNIGANTPTIDANGDVFFSNIVQTSDGTTLTFTTEIQELVAVNGVIPANATPVVVYSAATPALAPLAIAADGRQNVFVANAMDGRGLTQDLLELSPAGSSPPPAAQAALTPASAEFGSVTTGSSSAPTVFTLANAGNATLAISSVALGGANPNLFAVGANTCGASLAAGASCTVAVTFTPSSPGGATATLSVTDSVGTQVAMLSGAGAAPAAAQAALSPATADFGSEPVGTVSAASTFTLSNAGSAALGITSIALVGTNAADFAIAANTCGTSLAASASCTVNVTFKASSVGNETATLSVADSVGTQTSTLTGAGTAAADFSLTATPDAQTVSAGSSAAYTIDVASVGGTFTAAVTLSASGLPPGASVVFEPGTVTPGTNGAMATMTIQTGTASAANRLERLHGPLGAPLLALALGVPICLRKKRRIACLGLVVVALGLQGCGGGFALPQTAHPAAQTYTVTVSGVSGTTQHTTTVQISIQS